MIKEDGMTNGMEKKVLDYMVELKRSGADIVTWKVTDKNLVMYDEDGRRTMVRLSDIEEELKHEGFLSEREYLDTLARLRP